MIEVGSSVTDFAKGDAVVFHLSLLHGQGSFAEYCLVEAAAAVKIPNGMPLEVAASTPCAGMRAL